MIHRTGFCLSQFTPPASPSWLESRNISRSSIFPWQCGCPSCHGELSLSPKSYNSPSYSHNYPGSLGSIPKSSIWIKKVLLGDINCMPVSIPVGFSGWCFNYIDRLRIESFFQVYRILVCCATLRWWALKSTNLIQNTSGYLSLVVSCLEDSAEILRAEFPTPSDSSSHANPWFIPDHRECPPLKRCLSETNRMVLAYAVDSEAQKHFAKSDALGEYWPP